MTAAHTSVDGVTAATDGISVDGLSAGYGGVAVVRELDLHVLPGEVVALLGPNGAGKTTTLLSISGMLKPLGGTVWLLGADVDTRSPYENARRGLAHVAEDGGSAGTGATSNHDATRGDEAAASGRG